jgi:multiple antibiotic resistance protein
MDSVIVPLLKSLVLVPVTVLPIINPLTTAPIFAANVGADPALAERLARQVAINSWILIIASILVGSWVLALFGISLPIVRVAGGLLVAATAWRMLQTSEDDDVHAAAAARASEMSKADAVRRSFYPITFPLTTGPGTIAASITLGAQIPATPLHFVAEAFAAALGAALVSAALYVVFGNAARVIARLGEVGALVLTRLMAFLLLCVGIQIMWTGWAELAGGPAAPPAVIAPR